MEYEKGDVLICTVESIHGTNVFVETKSKKRGTIVLSEIAPGRIRNLRDYVVPKKTIICKVLGKKGENLELSLRRVTPKEKKELLEQEKIEKSYRNILKTVLREKSREIIEKIEKEKPLLEFLEESKENPKKLEEVVTKEDAEKILEILQSQRAKKIEIKRRIKLSTQEPDGLEKIKGILGNIKNAEMKYISAGNYSIKVEEESLKKADQKIHEILTELEKEARKNKLSFSETK